MKPDEKPLTEDELVALCVALEKLKFIPMKLPQINRSYAQFVEPKETVH